MSEIVDSAIKKATKGTTLILAGTVAGALLLLVNKILIVRNTTKEELGTYTLAVAIVSVLALIATLGVHEGIARYVSLFLAKDNAGEADSRSRAAIRIAIASSVIAGFTLYFGSGFLSSLVFKNPALIMPLKIISVSVPFFVMTQILNAILRGHGMITPKVCFIDIGIPLFFLFLLGGILLLNMSFISILYAYLFSIIFGFIAVGSYGYRNIGLNPFRLRNARRQGELLLFSLPLLIGIVMAMIMKWMGILMLGGCAGPKAVGVYEVSSSLSLLMMIPLAALEYAFLPVAGTLHGRGQSEELKRTYQVLAKLVFSATVPIFFTLFLFPEAVITTLFGERFNDAAPALRVLSCGFLFHSLWGPNGILMVVIGMPKEISSVSIFGAVLNIVLNCILIQFYELGIMGAAIAIAGTYVGLNIVVSTVIYRKAGIQPFTAAYLKSIMSAVFCMSFILILRDYLPRYVWLIPFYLLLFILGYGFALLITRSMDIEEITIIKGIIARIKANGSPLRGRNHV
ncbi:MAG: flippase [Syntrophobacteraceae bacterium]|jgi:O-antigen/teichoic acid export membrane protein